MDIRLARTLIPPPLLGLLVHLSVLTCHRLLTVRQWLRAPGPVRLIST